MATLSSTLAWKRPWTEEPGRLQSMVLQRVRYDWATSLSHREQPMHTTSFMERFSFSQVCIFSAGYCREICLMWTGVSWQRQCSHPLGFPGGWDDKESACSVGDLGLIPGWEDTLEKKMATHYRIHAWKIPWAKEPGRLQSMGVTKSQTQLSDLTFFLSSFKARVFHSQTHLGKFFGCCFSLHCSQFLAQPADFSDGNTVLGSPY